MIKFPQKIILNKHLKKLLKVIIDLGGKPLLVGGCVRDILLKIKPKDFDIEVYGLEAHRLENGLKQYFDVNLVGKTFGIFLVVVEENNQKMSFDVSLPRKENKIGIGHKSFSVTFHKDLTFKEASSRRDFTINAMGLDPVNMTLIDPHNGYLDLQNKVLKHVSRAFSEDPLRVLRGAQFCARFLLTPHEETVKLCKLLKNELFSLSKERIFEEIKKLLLAQKPSLGFLMLKNTESLDLFLELKELIDLKQEELWHPEGDVWVHTLMVLDEAAMLVKNSLLEEEEKLIIMAGAMCHDLGKIYTTIIEDGKIKSPGHEEKGAEPCNNLLLKMGFSPNFIKEVIPLVKEHLKPHQLYSVRHELSKGALKRLSLRVNIERLLYVSKADFLGRTTKEALERFDPAYEWLKEESKKLNIENKPPKPLLMGRHLIDLGILPGKEMGIILKEALEAQLDGVFNTEEGAILYAKNRLKKC